MRFLIVLGLMAFLAISLVAALPSPQLDGLGLDGVVGIVQIPVSLVKKATGLLSGLGR